LPEKKNTNVTHQSILKVKLKIEVEKEKPSHALSLSIEPPKKTRCVIHNGPAINLISAIDIYDKLVIARGIF